jgi:hypothetical protein
MINSDQVYYWTDTNNQPPKLGQFLVYSKSSTNIIGIILGTKETIHDHVFVLKHRIIIVEHRMNSVLKEYLVGFKKP